VPQLLYRWAVVDSEAKVILLLHRLALESRYDSGTAHTPWGHHVRELHILFEPSEGQEDISSMLQALIASSSLPLLRSLGISVMFQPRTTGDFVLQPSFWDALAQNCPQLAELRLEGPSDLVGHPWNGSQIMVNSF
jgi:hypothetical protein